MIDARRETPSSLRADMLVVLFLIGLDVAARLLPHTPNFMPLTASALFAGVIVSRRSLALAVTLVALSDIALGFDDWRIALLDYAALTLPVAVGIYGRRFRLSRMLVPAALSCSLLFFAVSNFAVWVFGGLYSPDMAGLVKCYVLALPFLQYTVAGDLIWVAVLFGAATLVQRLANRSNAVTA
jgi:Family of unknown function (DUF6580)